MAFPVSPSGRGLPVPAWEPPDRGKEHPGALACPRPCGGNRAAPGLTARNFADRPPRLPASGAASRPPYGKHLRRMKQTLHVAERPYGLPSAGSRREIHREIGIRNSPSGHSSPPCNHLKRLSAKGNVCALGRTQPHLPSGKDNALDPPPGVAGDIHLDTAGCRES